MVLNAESKKVTYEFQAIQERGEHMDLRLVYSRKHRTAEVGLKQVLPSTTATTSAMSYSMLVLSEETSLADYQEGISSLQRNQDGISAYGSVGEDFVR